MEAEASDRGGLILPQRFLHIQNVQDGFHLLIHQRFQLSVLHFQRLLLHLDGISCPDTEASETQTTEKTQQTWGSIGGYYTVKRGDTLAGISKKMYQSYNYIEMIAEANGIDNVDEIYPGQILEIPQIED